MHREYQLIRVRAGDYLLPSNDGKTLWRISSYEEYGDAEIGDGKGGWIPLKGTFWQASRFELGGPEHAAALHDEEILDWDNWTGWITTERTRREAIESALRYDGEV